jgi:peptide/nickel transport system substrate-binding protein
LAVAVCLAVVALVVWTMATDWDGASQEKHAAAAGSSGPSARPVHSSPVPTPTSGVISDVPDNTEVGFNAAADYVWNPSTKAGGTLRLLAAADCDSWDPGRTKLGWCWNLQRLITRTLVAYTLVSDTQFELVKGIRYKLGPDLATSLGTHNSDYTRWTYSLRSGLEFADGESITPRDVAYGIERNRATLRQDGIDTISTTDASITFTLAGPDAGFDYLMALPAAAPVPPGGRPVASGPFEIQAHKSNKSVVFVRNPNWSQSTDVIRHPLVDKVVLTVDPSVADIDRRLHAGAADARADGGVQASFESQLLTNYRLKGNADDPILDATRYLAVVPSVIPNIHCRRAIFYAFDKAAAERVFGGPTAGVLASAMTPPGIEGYTPILNPYPSGSDGRGDVKKAAHELKLCGKPRGFATKIIYATPSETGPRLFAAEQKALGRVGIKIVPQAIEGAYEVVTPAELKTMGVGLVEESAQPQLPTAYDFYAPFLRYHSRLPTGLIWGPLDDPTVQRVLTDARNGTASTAAWTMLDRAVMADAVYLPFLWERVLYYRNPRMTNVTSDNAIAYGIYDFVNVGVR